MHIHMEILYKGLQFLKIFFNKQTSSISKLMIYLIDPHTKNGNNFMHEQLLYFGYLCCHLRYNRYLQGG